MASALQWVTVEGPECRTANTVIYAIGDIHAQPGLLSAALRGVQGRIDERGAKSWCIVLLGDLIDRGTAVVETLASLQAVRRSAPSRVRLIRGNHEEAFCAFVEGRLAKRELFEWIELYGGRQTLEAVGIEAGAALADYDEGNELVLTSHARDLYRVCSSAFDHFAIGTLGFSHTPDDATSLMRRRRLDLVVHGHVVVDKIECKEGRINIDLGSYIRGTVGVLEITSGCLTAAVASAA